MENRTTVGAPVADAARDALRPGTLWLLSFCLACLFAAFQIQSSLHSGVLSVPVTYDDVAYFTDALARLEILYREGFAATLKNLFTVPPHAPLQTLLAMLGFGLLGRHPWAADAMNVLPLTLMIRLFLGTAVRSLSLDVSVVLAAAFLGVPLFGMLIVEFRPDMLCALFTAIGTFMIVADPRWREGDRATGLTTSALFAGALLAKPTLAPVTVFVFGTAAIAVVALFARSVVDAKRISKRVVLFGGLGMLLALPYYIVGFRSIYEYVAEAVLGTNASVFALNISRRAHALYYLTGPGGATAIGRPWLLLSTALLVASSPIWARSRRRALAVFAVAFAAYIAVTVPGMKTVFIGLVVPAFLIVIVATSTVALLSRMRRPAALVAATLLLVVSALTWRPVAMQMSGAVIAVQAEALNRVATEIADAVAKVPDLGHQHLYFPLTSQFVNREGLEYELRLRGLAVPEAPVLYFETDMAKQAAALEKSQIAILFSDDNTMPLDWTLSTRIRKDITALVERGGAFESIAVIDAGPYRGTVKVLRRTRP
ncbi:ArnT family glycosyltransferase [Variovorax ginsengisoli]|uniref:Glycosyltransferase RgtA/B/C/D-like domain-containing protein n=1 Tax=Variovorax ginsengisoli TaxID=363844 RepID=A0ABT8SB97_9BURK|nr:hypothetical protein [Variovorax ginsengisoli]MDN8617018.1 hypothetical protein [Variovorax ginsengisoli]MDO1536188.1 hypothetical protein [Variovorax ginsengisoli]